MLKTINSYDNSDVSINDIYSKAERGIEKSLIDLQDESMIFGFVAAMKLVRDTPMNEVVELIESVLKDY